MFSQHLKSRGTPRNSLGTRPLSVVFWVELFNLQFITVKEHGWSREVQFTFAIKASLHSLELGSKANVSV